MNEIVSVKNLSFAYEGKKILEKTDFSLKKGDFYLLTGSNGTGKSTFLKLLVGLLKAQQGCISLCGQDINRFSNWEKIGYLSQKATSFNFNFPATVEEILAAHIICQKKKWKMLTGKDRRKIAEALELVGLLGEEKKLLGRLSGGQQQRVFIARTLISEPELLLLDEPNVGLDKKNADALADLLQKLNAEKKTTILLIAHNWLNFSNLPAVEIAAGKLVYRKK